MYANEDEETLINNIRLGNEDALIKLAKQYKPMIEKTRQQYYIRDYDEQDWEQEAIIACYKSVVAFSGEKGKFGPFYAKNFRNRILNILRFSLANRRRAHTCASSLDKLPNIEGLLKEAMYYSINEVPVSESYQNFYESLSQIEFIAFLIIIGKYSTAEAVNKWQISVVQLNRARSRVYHKLRKVLF